MHLEDRAPSLGSSKSTTCHLAWWDSAGSHLTPVANHEVPSPSALGRLTSQQTLAGMGMNTLLLLRLHSPPKWLQRIIINNSNCSTCRATSGEKAILGRAWIWLPWLSSLFSTMSSSGHCFISRRLWVLTWPSKYLLWEKRTFKKGPLTQLQLSQRHRRDTDSEVTQHLWILSHRTWRRKNGWPS